VINSSQELEINTVFMSSLVKAHRYHFPYLSLMHTLPPKSSTLNKKKKKRWEEQLSPSDITGLLK
jgi:hypothetical protein